MSTSEGLIESKMNGAIKYEATGENEIQILLNDVTIFYPFICRGFFFFFFFFLNSGVNLEIFYLFI
jgi:hypothetical protein